MTWLATLALGTWLATAARGHMLLSKPLPFDAEAGLNSPLDGPQGPGGGMVYPCQSPNYAFSFTRTNIPLGSVYNVTLAGSAVHGGGSCQMSLSADLEPTARSVFKVIHSVQGGCPAQNTAGNLPSGSSTAQAPDQYSFVMPKDIPPGTYTFAWTWFNRVGNREMYMHCAPIEVTDDQKGEVSMQAAKAAYDALPDMFLANIPGVPCSTLEGGDLILPEPGISLEVNFPPASWPAAMPPAVNGAQLSQCFAPLGIAESISDEPDNLEIQSMPASSAQTLASSRLATTEIPTSTVTNAGTEFDTTLVTFITSRTSDASKPTTMSAFSPNSDPATSCPANQVSCTGGLICIGADKFGLCNSGCAVPQQLATGTRCTNGQVLGLEVTKALGARRRAADQ